MTETKLKILHLVQRYHPEVGGMEEVVQQVSENMSKLGHEVHVASSKPINSRDVEIVNGVKVHRFGIQGNEVRGIKGNSEAFVTFLKTNKFDVISVFAAQQWSCDLFLQEIENIDATKVFVPTGFSGLNHPEYYNYFKMLSQKIKLFDANIFHSENYQDYIFAKENSAKRMSVIPNGVSKAEFESLEYDREEISKLKISENETVIISIGNHTGLKGHHETIEIFKRSNLPDNAKLFIIGKSFFPNPCIIKCKIKSVLNNIFSKKKIYVMDLPRNQLVQLLKRADLMLFPSNIECAPLVISEALVSNTFYLASDVGNIREMNQKYGGGYILPTQKISSGFSKVDITKSIDILNQNPSDTMQHKVNNDKRSQLLEALSWQSITIKYLETYIKAVQKKDLHNHSFHMRQNE